MSDLLLFIWMQTKCLYKCFQCLGLVLSSFLDPKWCRDLRLVIHKITTAHNLLKFNLIKHDYSRICLTFLSLNKMLHLHIIYISKTTKSVTILSCSITEKVFEYSYDHSHEQDRNQVKEGCLSLYLTFSTEHSVSVWYEASLIGVYNVGI